MMLQSALVAGIFLAGDAVRRVDQTLSLLPPYKLGRALLLDSILGPAEAFEYVSKTAPSSPPQTIS
jgi:hypothetical protein